MWLHANLLFRLLFFGTFSYQIIFDWSCVRVTRWLLTTYVTCTIFYKTSLFLQKGSVKKPLTVPLCTSLASSRRLSNFASSETNWMTASKRRTGRCLKSWLAARNKHILPHVISRLLQTHHAYLIAHSRHNLWPFNLNTHPHHDLNSGRLLPFNAENCFLTHLVLLGERLLSPGLFVYVVYMYIAHTPYASETLRPFITYQPIQTSRRMINHCIEWDIVTY